MDIRKIKKLMDLLEASQLTELEIKQGEESIRLSRAMSASLASPAVALRTLPESGPSTVATSGAASVIAPATEPEALDGHVITSPMVGTYYASPTPESEPFARVGARVDKGDTLCIIEAMKIFNQIEADRAGVLRSIFKQTGDPVEYGETLFVIDATESV